MSKFLFTVLVRIPDLEAALRRPAVAILAETAVAVLQQSFRKKIRRELHLLVSHKLTLLVITARL